MESNENSFEDILPASRGYWLSQVRLERTSGEHTLFRAKLNGPDGMPVWARAWLSTEAGTLAEAVSDQLKAGDEVTLMLVVCAPVSPEFAYMRIESAPLQTEHVVRRKLA